MKRKDLILIVPKEYNEQFCSSNSRKIHRMNKSITENVINSPYEDINGEKASNEHLKKLSLLPVISKENLFNDNMNKITYERKRPIEDNKNRNKYKIKKNPLSIQYLSLKESSNPFDKYLKSLLNKRKSSKKYNDIKNDNLLLNSNLRKKMLKKFIDKTYEKEKNEFKKYYYENKDELADLLESEIISIAKTTKLNNNNGIYRNQTEFSLQSQVENNDMNDNFNSIKRDNYNGKNKLYANDRKNCSNEKKKISKYINDKEKENINNFIIHNIFFEWVIDKVFTKINDHKLKNYLYNKNISKSAKNKFKQLVNKEISNLSNYLFKNKINLYSSYDSLINSLRPISDYVIKLRNKSRQIISNNKKIKSADLAKSKIIDNNSLNNELDFDGKEERIIKNNIINKLVKKIIDGNNIKNNNYDSNKIKNGLDENDLSKYSNRNSNSNSYDSNDKKIYSLKNKNRVKSGIDSSTKVSPESKSSKENQICIKLRRNLNTFELPMIQRSKNDEYFDNLMDKFYSRNFKNYFYKKRFNTAGKFKTEEKEENILRKNLEPRTNMKKNNTECILDYNSNVNNNIEFNSLNKINDIQNNRNILNLSNNNNNDKSLKLQQKLNIKYLNNDIIFNKEKPLLNKHLINPKFLFNKIESYNNLDTNEDKNNEIRNKNLRYNLFNKFIYNNKIHNNIALIPKKKDLENRGKTINAEKLPKIYKLFGRNNQQSIKEINSSNINKNNVNSNNVNSTNNINSNNNINNNNINNNIDNNNKVNNINQQIKSSISEKNKKKDKNLEKILLKNNSSNENEKEKNNDIKNDRKDIKNNNTNKNEANNQKIKGENMNKDSIKGKEQKKLNNIRINKSYEKKEKRNYFNINNSKELNSSNDEIIKDKYEKDKGLPSIINSKKEKEKEKENNRNKENIDKEKIIKNKEEIKNDAKKEEVDEKNNIIEKEKIKKERNEVKEIKDENKGKNKKQGIKDEKSRNKENKEKNIKKFKTKEKIIEEKEINKNIKKNNNAHSQNKENKEKKENRENKENKVKKENKENKVNIKEELKNNLNEVNKRKINIESIKGKADLKIGDDFKKINENIKMKNIFLSNESKDNKKIENIKTDNISLSHIEKEKPKSPSINDETIGIKDEDKNNQQKNEHMKKILINLFNRYIPKNDNNKIEKDEENENAFLDSIDNKDVEKLIFYKEQIHNLKDIKEKSEEDTQQQEDLKEKLKEIIMKYVNKLLNKKLISENKDEFSKNGNEVNDINIHSEEIMKLIFNNSEINELEQGEEESEGEGEGEREEKIEEEGELDEKKVVGKDEVENNSKNGSMEQDEKEDDNIISENRRRKRKTKIRRKHLSIIDKMKEQLEQFDIKDKNEIISFQKFQKEITSEEKLRNFFRNIKKLKNSIQNENIVQKIMNELFDENIEIERCQKKSRILNFIEQIQNINNRIIIKPKVNFLSPIKFSIHNISKNTIKYPNN